MSVARAAGMAKGRNRKNVAREPNGRPQREKIRPHNQRLFDVARFRDPRLSTPLGLMAYNGAITEALYEAGMAYRDAREAADRALGIAGRQPRGQDLSAVRGLGMVADNDEARLRRERCDKRLAAMEAAIGDHVTLGVVQSVAIYDLVPGGTDKVEMLVRGLTRLAAWRKGGRA